MTSITFGQYLTPIMESSRVSHLLQRTKRSHLEVSKCPEGLIENANQHCVPPEITQNIFVYDNPVQTEIIYEKKRPNNIKPSTKVDYNIIVLKGTPEHQKHEPIIYHPQSERGFNHYHENHYEPVIYHPHSDSGNHYHENYHEPIVYHPHSDSGNQYHENHHEPIIHKPHNDRGLHEYHDSHGDTETEIYHPHTEDDTHDEIRAAMLTESNMKDVIDFIKHNSGLSEL